MKFAKMQGCGNDYIYVDCFKETVENPQETAIKISDRHFGVGSDGLILIYPSKVADFKMTMYNADGSEGKMCGNGIRCVAKYVYDFGLTDKTELKIETLSGIKTLKLNIKDKKVDTVQVDMGSPILVPEQIPVKFEGEIMVDEAVAVNGLEYHLTCVSMGNPHAVVFVDNIKILNLEKIGPDFEQHKIFPDKVNTEFIHIIDKNTIEMRVWERGSGETLACGTGACASVVACVLNGLTGDEVLVHLLGGDLKIKYDREKNTVLMTGPAELVCTGEIQI
ncbi:MAG: diaminopimelate epimerase [Lachnospiraceae bacterium]|nr:diaminopimelate epimerase [Lachnospiraceae bacterium]MCI9370021.1 diaminopimelate epimerase [Lachnospiraceae bacterium]MDE7309416.1 diaminopimelate epimerase [Lachnospiraceae bacterium]